MSFNISKVNAIGPLKNAIEFKNSHKIQMNQITQKINKIGF